MTMRIIYDDIVYYVINGVVCTPSEVAAIFELSSFTEPLTPASPEEESETTNGS